MPRVRVFHWRASEAAPLIEAVRRAGYQVEYEEGPEGYRAARRDPPDAVVIDLTRQPSQGREVAISLRSLKSTRRVPLVFVGGEPEKIEGIRRLLPDAAYTPRAKIRGALRWALANVPAQPAQPLPMMQRYGGRSVAQKLGIAAGARVAAIDPPPDYRRALGALPADVEFREEPAADSTLTLWFFRGPAEFQSALRRLRSIAARHPLWVLWRKGNRDGLNAASIRAGARTAGLVDYKVCAFDAVWTGAMLAIQKTGVETPARKGRARSPGR